MSTEDERCSLYCCIIAVVRIEGWNDIPYDKLGMQFTCTTSANGLEFILSSNGLQQITLMRAAIHTAWRLPYKTTRRQPDVRFWAGRRATLFSTTSRLRSDTIYALSTAPGRAAIAIVRVSGPACLDVYKSLCPGKPDPQPRHATVRRLYRQNDILDSNALVLYFPGPKTATGEDVLEFHVHGGTAVLRAVLDAIPSTSTLRYAEPGEFTRRAFMNDRLDLTQVEALGDVLAATTEQQRRLSVRGTSNALATCYEEWRTQLLYARGSWRL